MAKEFGLREDRPQELGLEFVACDLCGNNKFRKVCSYGDVQIVRCAKCHLIYRNPRKTESTTRQFYNSAYYEKYKGREDDISGARQVLFKKALFDLERLLGRVASRKILDIGCGQGHFLKLAKDSGWQVKGVELSRGACDYARKNFGIDVINRSVEEVNFETNYFDVITLWNVLDHLLSPTDMLKEINRILKAGGILVIRVPNVNFNLFAHMAYTGLAFFSEDKKFEDPSVITNFGFSSKTLSGLLRKTGYSKVAIYNSPVSRGDPYKSFGKTKSVFVVLIKNFYVIFSHLIYYLSFKNIHIGSSLLAYAVK
jgi:2-polyprenyl-3-methyl-5-hydroxy-6-metoxy-1,4-benzoquinol methylase